VKNEISRFTATIKIVVDSTIGKIKIRG